jgi:hypothetical protein
MIGVSMKGIGFGGKRPTTMKRTQKTSNMVKAPMPAKNKFAFKPEIADKFQAMKKKGKK